MIEEVESQSKKVSQTENKYQNNPLWWVALHLAEKKKDIIKTTPTRYAQGIIKIWIDAGYESVQDLVNAGEVTQEDIDKNKLMEGYKSLIHRTWG